MRAADLERANRDAEICRAYAAGEKTLQECADEHGISRQRVKQILKKAGIQRFERKGVDRNTFLGVVVGEDVKTALRDEADRRGVSVSALSDHGLAKMLVEMGYTNVTVEELPKPSVSPWDVIRKRV